MNLYDSRRSDSKCTDCFYHAFSIVRVEQGVGTPIDLVL